MKIDARVHLAPHLTPKRVGVAVTGDGGAGLSIYKDGRRIPLRYRVVGAQGQELAQGALRYG